MMRQLNADKARALMLIMDDRSWISESIIADEIPMTPRDWNDLAVDCRFERARRAHGRHSYRLTPIGSHQSACGTGRC